jgi:hypothetical protein
LPPTTPMRTFRPSGAAKANLDPRARPAVAIELCLMNVRRVAPLLPPDRSRLLLDMYESPRVRSSLIFGSGSAPTTGKACAGGQALAGQAKPSQVRKGRVPWPMACRLDNALSWSVRGRASWAFSGIFVSGFAIDGVSSCNVTMSTGRTQSRTRLRSLQPIELTIPAIMTSLDVTAAAAQMVFQWPKAP